MCLIKTTFLHQTSIAFLFIYLFSFNCTKINPISSTDNSVKYKSDYKWIWAKQYGNINNLDNYTFKFDRISKRMYITNPTGDALINCYDSSGNKIWSVPNLNLSSMMSFHSPMLAVGSDGSVAFLFKIYTSNLDTLKICDSLFIIDNRFAGYAPLENVALAVYNSDGTSRFAVMCRYLAGLNSPSPGGVAFLKDGTVAFGLRVGGNMKVGDTTIIYTDSIVTRPYLFLVDKFGKRSAVKNMNTGNGYPIDLASDEENDLFLLQSDRLTKLTDRLNVIWDNPFQYGLGIFAIDSSLNTYVYTPASICKFDKSGNKHEIFGCQISQAGSFYQPSFSFSTHNIVFPGYATFLRLYTGEEIDSTASFIMCIDSTGAIKWLLRQNEVPSLRFAQYNSDNSIYVSGSRTNSNNIPALSSITKFYTFFGKLSN